MPISFSHPWVLLALLALPLIWGLARWSRSGLERGRSAFSTILRVVLYALVVLSLAGMRWVQRSDRAATIFLLDWSDSIPPDLKEQAESYVKKQLGRVKAGDQAGVVVFGRQAMIETPASKEPKFIGVHSMISRSATDLASAIRLALAAFPEGYQRRIVLITDGNENRGHALAEVEQARRHGVQINVLRIDYEYKEEVWVEDLYVPSEISPKEPFDVHVVIHANTEGPVTVRLYRNEVLVAEDVKELKKGKNIYVVQQKRPEPGPQRYEVRIETAGGDTVYQNNAAFGFTHVRGTARLLVVGGEPRDVDHLTEKLREEGLATVVVEPGRLREHIPELTHFDAILFANVGVEEVPAGVMHAIEAAVHDAGVGFLMIGGENSFGPGGYRGTPLEKVLPVTMDQPQRRVLPNGALVLVLHTVEIPQGNKWAKDIALAAMRTLGPRDYFGILYYQYTGNEKWLFKPRPVADRSAMARLIRNVAPEDMPDFDATMRMAHREMKPLIASAKHIVIISDGDPANPSPNLIKSIIKDGITMSTVVIAPHTPDGVSKMADLARAGRGRAYYPRDPRKLPEIFIREARTIRRSMVIEKDFVPTMRPGVQAFKGIDRNAVPPLHGYVLTNPKATTEIMMSGPEGDIIFGQWRYGLGTAAVFTSDAKDRWSSDWVAWPPYQKIWAQMIRSLLRSVDRAPYSINVEISGGRGHVVIDAVDEQGKYVHTLKFNGSATAPDGDRRLLDFRQTGPGRYEASFDADDVGIYSINAAFDQDGKTGFLSVGTAVPYVAEYRDLKTNTPLLERMADVTGGRMLYPDDEVYLTLAATVGFPKPLWFYLLLAMIPLFVLDVFIRRVALEWSQVVGGWAWVRARVFPKRREPVEAPAPLKALLTRKEEIRAETLRAPPGEAFDLDQPAGSPRAVEPPKEAKKPKPEPKPAEERPDYLKRLLDAKKKARDK